MAVHSTCACASRRYEYLRIDINKKYSGHIRVRKKTEDSFDFDEDAFVSDGLPQQHMLRDENIADKVLDKITKIFRVKRDKLVKWKKCGET